LTALGRVLLAAALVFAAPAPVDPAPGTPPAPAWSLHYGFGTGLYGGTTFDVDASGQYDLVASSIRFPRSERSGTLAPAELQTIARLVADARTSTWSSSYRGYSICHEHVASLQLSRARDRDPGSIAVTWTCGLPGVPADLRALIVALRAHVKSLLPDAQTDALPNADAIPVSAHDAMSLVTGDRTRSVSIAADGTILSRRRTSTALYAVAACPVRDLGAVDPPVLAKLHALLTPTADVFFATSRETAQIFERTMNDCGAPACCGYTSPEYLVPRETRWILKATRADNDAVVSVDIDSGGRSLVARKGSDPVRPTVGGATVRALGRLISDVPDDVSVPAGYGPNGCELLVQITHVAPDGTRRNRAAIDAACDPTDAPPAVRALYRFIGERVVPELAAPR